MKVYLEISARRYGKTHRLIEAAKKWIKEYGGIAVIYGRYSELSSLINYKNAIINPKLETLRGLKPEKVYFFYDDLELLEGVVQIGSDIPITPKSYFTGSNKLNSNLRKILELNDGEYFYFSSLLNKICFSKCDLKRMNNYYGYPHEYSSPQLGTFTRYTSTWDSLPTTSNWTISSTSWTTSNSSD